jgi:hypothetical protein
LPRGPVTTASVKPIGAFIKRSTVPLTRRVCSPNSGKPPAWSPPISSPFPPDHEKHSLDEHDELLEAIADHDSEHARSIAERHVLEAGRSLAAWLDQR